MVSCSLKDASLTYASSCIQPIDDNRKHIWGNVSTDEITDPQQALNASKSASVTSAAIIVALLGAAIQAAL